MNMELRTLAGNVRLFGPTGAAFPTCNSSGHRSARSLGVRPLHRRPLDTPVATHHLFMTFNLVPPAPWWPRVVM